MDTLRNPVGPTPVGGFPSFDLFKLIKVCRKDRRLQSILDRAEPAPTDWRKLPPTTYDAYLKAMSRKP